LEERIETLESQLRKVEEENDLLRTLNKTFGNESDKLNNENKLLNAKLDQYRQFAFQIWQNAQARELRQ
jgi:hypothetical protein